MNAKERFMAKVMPIPESGCWIWDGYTDAKMGYGMFWFDGPMRQSHRVSYALFKSEIPDGMHVCHSCDVPSCVNPSHLWLGTNAENVADKVRKGRVRNLRGTDHPMAKLSEGQVLDIRRSGLSGRAIAKALGIDRSTVQYIRNGKLWGHL